jgi:hypothetical protein
LRAIGETTALGTLLSLTLAPTVMVALRIVEPTTPVTPITPMEPKP